MPESKLKYFHLLYPKDRPRCPRCKSYHIISRGIEWGCADCGRRWAKRKNWGRNYGKQERKRKTVD